MSNGVNDKKQTLVPRLRFPEFREAEGWDAKQFCEISTIVMGASPKSDSYNQIKCGLPLLQGNADIKNRLSAPRVFASQITKECLVGDILLSVRAPVGTVAKSLHHACIGRGIAAIRTKNSYSQEFLYQWLLSFESQWENLSQGGTFDAVNSNDIRQLKAAIPSTKEQQKIADCLSSLDALIAAQADKIDALKTHKKGLMQQLFPREGETVPRLRFPEFLEAGEWVEKEIGKVFDGTRGYVLSMTLVSEGWSDEAPYPVYSSQTKRNGLVGYYSEYLYENAITWTTDGANAGDVKYRDGKFYCTNVCGVLLNDKGYANICIAELLNTRTREHVSYVGNPKLMNGVMSKIVIPFPKPEEQQKIADCLSSLDALIAAQADKLDALKTHKKGLMQQLFPREGETVPRLRFPEFRDAEEWGERPLGDCLDYLQPTNYLVSSTDYDEKHQTPVLTAGKTFILGYTDETQGIFDRSLPVIIFDDFTTASKFVDFPFKAKSSAMKILLAKKSANIKFVFESMQMIRYEVGVHERHWISIFSKLTVPLPPRFEEQQKIADCLSSLDALIAAQASKLDALKTHKKGLMQQLFPSPEAVGA